MSPPDARIADLRGLLIVFVAASLSYVMLARDGLLVSLDSSTQYLPWYTYLGESLRAGRIPGWNPASFGGTPFAADPLSGWTYLPAMLLFTALPSDWAAQAIVLFHPLLAGAGTYALARMLGLPPPAASVAAIAYACSGFMQLQSVAAQPYTGVAAWLPIGLLGVERSMRCEADLRRRLAWWGVVAVAVCQAAAVWPGQGAAYACLVVGGFSFVSAVATRGQRSRVDSIAWVAAHVAMPLLLATLLSAAGLLPRLEFLALSNLADGHPLEAQRVGGWRFEEWWWRVLAPGYWSVGVATVALAALGTLVVRTRMLAAPLLRATVYLSAVWFGALVLTHGQTTPLHTAVYLVPGFERLHAHIPERIMIVAYMGPALLAGIAFGHLFRRFGWARAWLVGIALVGTLLLEADLARQTLMHSTWDALRVGGDPGRSLVARFLQERRLHDDPFRFVGFGPELDTDGGPLPYTHTFDSPRTRALLVNNRAIALGLEDLQGYAAIRLAAFDALLLAVNQGQAQDYHDGYILDAGLRSPLLDLLGVRYLLVPSDVLPHEPGLIDDGTVKVIHRTHALPRAWVVHEVHVASPPHALEQIAVGSVDPRRTAVVDQPLGLSSASAAETPADILTYTPDVIAARVTLDQPGLLVFAEMYYPAWRAYVDGQPAPVLRADAVLRGVPVPAGEHVVELRFESLALAVGCAISLTTALGLSVITLASVRTRPA